VLLFALVALAGGAEAESDASMEYLEKLQKEFVDSMAEEVEE
jgi:hypothetical protein